MRFIAGSGRSGTTWILDCLADANALRPVFEPLHPATSRVAARYAYRALSPAESHPELESLLRDVQKDHYWSVWTTYRCLPQNLFPCRESRLSLIELKRVRYRWSKLLSSLPALVGAARRSEPLIKCIRANLALGWLVETFHAKAILVVRHPCAVVESQHRLGGDGKIWDPRPTLARYKSDHKLHELTHGAYLQTMARHLSNIEALALLWVIENQYPIRLGLQHLYEVFYYEHIVGQPELQWPRISHALSLARWPTQSSWRKPSQQTSDTSGSHRDNPASSWVGRFKQHELDEIQRVLDETDCHIYNVREVLPSNIAIG